MAHNRGTLKALLLLTGLLVAIAALGLSLGPLDEYLKAHLGELRIVQIIASAAFTLGVSAWFVIVPLARDVDRLQRQINKLNGLDDD
jgi:hypothetical protein